MTLDQRIREGFTAVGTELKSVKNTINGKASTTSPTFTGTPKAPTAATGTNTTQIATTAFVKAAVDAKTSVASATKATQDANGNVIANTYATKAEVSNSLKDKADKENSIYFIDGTGTTEGEWLGTHADIPAYYQGLTIAYKIGIAGISGGSTLNINNLGAVAVIRNNGSAITTHYGIGSILILTYDIGADTGTPYWKMADYDSDTKTRSSNKTGSKMYIIGASTQSTSGQTTYSNSNCYIGTDNALYSLGKKVATITDLESKSDTSHTHTNESLGSGYGTCSDYATTSAKTVTLSNYKLVKGGIVVIKFSGNVLANATLNINSTGAKALFYKGKAIVDGVICAGEYATIMYDGTQYNVLTVDRNRFYSSLVPYGTQIVPSETNLLDLNSPEYLKVGNYFCSNTASTEYLANKPEKTAFMLQVSSPLSQTVDDEMAGAWKYRLRRFIGYQGSEYLSYCSVGSTAGEWNYGPWYKVITSKDTVAKATQAQKDWSGNVITSTYAMLSGATFTGTVKAPGFQITSDKRLKSDIVELSGASEKVKHLSAYTYKLNGDNSGRRMGVIAQDVQKVIPEAVREDAEGYLSVDYAAITALTLQVNKELLERINKLEEKINSLI